MRSNKKIKSEKKKRSLPPVLCKMLCYVKLVICWSEGHNCLVSERTKAQSLPTDWEKNMTYWPNSFIWQWGGGWEIEYVPGISGNQVVSTCAAGLSTNVSSYGTAYVRFTMATTHSIDILKKNRTFWILPGWNWTSQKTCIWYRDLNPSETFSNHFGKWNAPLTFYIRTRTQTLLNRH